MKAILLKPGREKSVRQRHPWIFASAIDRVLDAPTVGESVLVRAATGEPLGWAAYSPSSKIALRMWNWDPEERIDESFIRRRIEHAISLRKNLIQSSETNAYRLIHAESDGLPGLVVDRYGDSLTVQILSAGPEFWKDSIVRALVELAEPVRIFERSDVDVRELEGLPARTGCLYGPDLQGSIGILENGLRFWVDIDHGQKTGFYLDQRRNRQRVRELVNGRSLLNCFCYTGAFSVYGLAGGATDVLSVDSSAEALQVGAQNLALNGLSTEHAAWMESDVFQLLRTMRDRRQSFDAIILDPPKFAPTVAQAERAARGYKDINLLAFKLLKPGGLLFTFSCSGGISAELFQKIVAGAALDAGVEARILEHLFQGADHPVALNFPEGAYLKGLICEVN
jgi:23S rRNA (cytosine1962-C5)-methyltransferase